MSTWGDMLDRGAGEKCRKEDDILTIEGDLNQGVTYSGTIRQSLFPSNPRTGQYYITTDDITVDGVQYHNGDLLMYDGNHWQSIGYIPIRVDAIPDFYYQSDL